MPAAHGSEPGESPKEGRLAGPRWADDGDELAWPNAERERAKGSSIAEMLADLLERKNRCGRHSGGILAHV